METWVHLEDFCFGDILEFALPVAIVWISVTNNVPAESYFLHLGMFIPRTMLSEHFLRLHSISEPFP